MIESEIESHLVWAVTLRGGTTYKFTSPAMRGVADRIVCMPCGKTFFVELKRPKGGEFSAQQMQFAQEMQRLNQNYVALKTKQEIDEWISKN